MTGISSRLFRQWFVLPVLPAFLALGMPAAAQPAAEPDHPFRNQNVTMIISFAPGGPVDGVARVLGGTLSEYLPTRPKIIYTNIPGADGVAALNRLYSVTRPDGLTVLIGAGNQLNPVNLKREQVKYDPTKLELVGGFANPSSYFLVRQKAIDRLTDHAAAPVQLAAIDGTRSGEQMGVWLAAALNWNLKMVVGYAGNANQVFAMQQGEVDMLSTNDVEVIRGFLASGDGVLVAQTGMLRGGRVMPSSVFPKAPILTDVIESKFQGKALEAFKFWSEFRQIGMWLALPPDTPKSYVALYRQAFGKALADPTLLRLIARFNPDPNELSAEDLGVLIREMVDTPNELVEYVDELTKKYR
jgi:tripartite-type tricarboxylate transporter receptor subunit TctC